MSSATDSEIPLIYCEKCGWTFDSIFPIHPGWSNNATNCPRCATLNLVPEGELPFKNPPWITLRFFNVVGFTSRIPEFASKLKSPNVRAVAEFFQKNIHAQHCMVDVFPYLAYTTMLFAKCRADVGDRPIAFPSIHDEEDGHAIDDLVKKQETDAEIAIRYKTDHGVFGSQETARAAHNDGRQAMGFVLKNAGESILIGARTALTTTLLGVWTAFETVAADLWESTLNIHPQQLADLSDFAKLARKKKEAGDESDEEDELKSVELVKIYELTEGSYDLSKCMGTLLKRRFSFLNLNGIRRAYNSAFSKDDAKVRDALGDKSLEALAAVRNLLVHRAGIVDDEFRNKAKNHETLLPQLDTGEELKINGDLVGRLISPVIQRTMDLLEAVDDWLDTHPTK